MIMYILNIARAIKKMSVNEIKVFTFEAYLKQIGFCKENIHYSMKYLEKNKLIEKLPDPHNAKEHYQSFIKKKNTKSVK